MVIIIIIYCIVCTFCWSIDRFVVIAFFFSCCLFFMRVRRLFGRGSFVLFQYFFIVQMYVDLDYDGSWLLYYTCIIIYFSKEKIDFLQREDRTIRLILEFSLVVERQDFHLGKTERFTDWTISTFCLDRLSDQLFQIFLKQKSMIRF